MRIFQPEEIRLSNLFTEFITRLDSEIGRSLMDFLKENLISKRKHVIL